MHDTGRCVAKRQARPCKAHKSNGDHCGAYAVNGALVCSVHGGRIPAVKEAARGRLMEAQAAKELARFSAAPPVRDPFSALLKLAGEAVAWKGFCEDRVQALDSLRYTSTMLLEQARTEVGMYERAIRLCLEVNTAVAKLDCESKLSRISDETARKLVEAMNRVARRLKFTPDMRGALWQAYADELRAVGLTDQKKPA